MKKIKNLIFAFVFSIIFFSGSLGFATNNVPIDANPSQKVCKGVKLNTNLPFLGRCIGSEVKGVNQLNAFGIMVKGLMKIVVSLVLIISFLMIVSAGVLMTMGGWDKSHYSTGITMITTVAKALALLGASGVILKLINPNFFT